MPRITITVADSIAQPYRFSLERQVITLGRGEENDIVIDSGSVSVKHAEIRRILGGYELVDLGSTNGIKLGEDRHSLIPLKNDTTAKIGDADLHFLLTEEEVQSLHYEQAPSPVPGPTSHQSAKEYSDSSPSGGSSATTLLFAILAAAAFFAGMAIRHQRDTGASLIHAMLAKPSPQSAPAAPTAP